MFEATMTSKGQVTIPAEIRKALNLTAGQRVVFTGFDDGTTLLRAKSRSVLELRGLLRPGGGTKAKVATEDMNIGRD